MEKVANTALLGFLGVLFDFTNPLECDIGFDSVSCRGCGRMAVLYAFIWCLYGSGLPEKNADLTQIQAFGHFWIKFRRSVHVLKF